MGGLGKEVIEIQAIIILGNLNSARGMRYFRNSQKQPNKCSIQKYRKDTKFLILGVLCSCSFRCKVKAIKPQKLNSNIIITGMGVNLGEEFPHKSTAR